MQTSIRLQNNIFLNKLQRKGDIEYYDKIMDSHMHYPFIVYSYAIRFKALNFFWNIIQNIFLNKVIITIFSRNYNYEFKPIK